MQKSGIFTKIKTAIINGGLDSTQLLLFYSIFLGYFCQPQLCVG